MAGGGECVAAEQLTIRQCREGGGGWPGWQQAGGGVEGEGRLKVKRHCLRFALCKLANRCKKSQCCMAH
jgi:hypothetical protein